MSVTRVCPGLVLWTLAALPLIPLHAQEDTFEWSDRMSSDQILEVRGIVGEIRASLASGDEAAVVARKRGDPGDFEEVAVEMARAGDRIVICAVYGSWKHGQGRCHPDFRDRGRDDHTHRDSNVDVEVDYEVRLPAGVQLEGAMVSGDVRGKGLRSDLSLHTVEGRISVVTTGRVHANTVSGDIEIEMGDLVGGDLDFNTVSGDIVLWLPRDFSADVEFSSLSGDFETDFDMSIRSKRSGWVGSRLEGTIGAGGRELSLRTVSGDVDLRRLRR